MGVFGRLFGGKTHELGAPASGEAVPSGCVSDETFAKEMLGSGMAIRPREGRAVSPCDGVVEMVFETGHAVTIRSEFGAQVLIHIGIDTIKLRGKHFAVHCRVGERVKRGQLLVEFDREAIAREGYDTVIPVVVLNSEAFDFIETATGKSVSEGEMVMRLGK